jgi:hypothetical protein
MSQVHRLVVGHFDVGLYREFFCTRPIDMERARELLLESGAKQVSDTWFEVDGEVVCFRKGSISFPWVSDRINRAAAAMAEAVAKDQNCVLAQEEVLGTWGPRRIFFPPELATDDLWSGLPSPSEDPLVFDQEGEVVCLMAGAAMAPLVLLVSLGDPRSRAQIFESLTLGLLWCAFWMVLEVFLLYDLARLARKLEINVRERTYRLWIGSWPFHRNMSGSLDDVERIAVWENSTEDRYFVGLEIVWLDKRRNFRLLEAQATITYDGECGSSWKQEMVSRADELSAVLRISPVVDVTDNSA